MSKRQLKQLSSIISLVLVLVVALGQHYGWFGVAAKVAETNDPGLYSINHYVDGDTIAVNVNGKTETVRFIGVDTPETHKPNTPVQCYGPAAAAYTKSEISRAGGKVRLVADPQSDDRDVYGRLVRYVYLPNGTLLDQALVQNGYGFAYTYYPFTKSADFTHAQEAARTSSKGLWGNCKPHQETNGRWQTPTAG